MKDLGLRTKLMKTMGGKAELRKCDIEMKNVNRSILAWKQEAAGLLNQSN